IAASVACFMKANPATPTAPIPIPTPVSAVPVAIVLLAAAAASASNAPKDEAIPVIARVAWSRARITSRTSRVPRGNSLPPGAHATHVLVELVHLLLGLGVLCHEHQIHRAHQDRILIEHAPLFG